jgi:protein tyrosine phosphatase (PTP) superfamily phosphohydrolase (DUF442 family)
VPRRPLNFRLLAALLLTVALAVWIYRDEYSTYHFAQVTPNVLYRDGNRNLRQFATACRKGQIKTVVMLNDDAELQTDPFKSEPDFCREHRISLVRIPIPLGGRPTSADIQKFLDTVNTQENQPVLVHCAQGVRRTAMMVAAYQETTLHFTPDQAKAAILPWGRKPGSRTLADIRSFIDAYDPQARTIPPTTAPASPLDSD